jgi:hypothetical protein
MQTGKADLEGFLERGFSRARESFPAGATPNPMHLQFMIAVQFLVD